LPQGRLPGADSLVIEDQDPIQRTVEDGFVFLLCGIKNVHCFSVLVTC